MAITVKDVNHLAKLADLALGQGTASGDSTASGESEAEAMAKHLDTIVGYVQQLSEVDTTGVEPVANVAGLVNVTRADVPGRILDRTQVLANAARHSDSAILVEKVVDR